MCTGSWYLICATDDNFKAREGTWFYKTFHVSGNLHHDQKTRGNRSSCFLFHGAVISGISLSVVWYISQCCLVCLSMLSDISIILLIIECLRSVVHTSWLSIVWGDDFIHFNCLLSDVMTFTDYNCPLFEVMNFTHYYCLLSEIITFTHFNFHRLRFQCILQCWKRHILTISVSLI